MNRLEDTKTNRNGGRAGQQLSLPAGRGWEILKKSFPDSRTEAAPNGHRFGSPQRPPISSKSSKRLPMRFNSQQFIQEQFRKEASDALFQWYASNFHNTRNFPDQNRHEINTSRNDILSPAQ